MKFDDYLWRDVWERNLNTVERHTIAVSVWRRRQPRDRFEALVAIELARRWRRHTVFLATIYGVWTLFWGLIAQHDLRLNDGFRSLLPPAFVVVGLLAIAACFAARRYIGGYLRAHAAPAS